MAFIRYKGPYAYLVANERPKGGRAGVVRQKVLFYFGREPRINDDVIAAVTRRFPDAEVDWPALKADLGARRRAAPARPLRTSHPPRPRRAPAARDDWTDWD